MFLWFRRIALHFIVNFAAIFAASKFIPGISFVSENWMSIAIAALVFGIVNTMIKPILSFFSVPFIILTLGLFMFVLNALMLELTDFIVADFVVDGFAVALKGALLITVVHYVAHWLMKETLEKK